MRIMRIMRMIRIMRIMMTKRIMRVVRMRIVIWTRRKENMYFWGKDRIMNFESNEGCTESIQ